MLFFEQPRCVRLDVQLLRHSCFGRRVLRFLLGRHEYAHLRRSMLTENFTAHTAKIGKDYYFSFYYLVLYMRILIVLLWLIVEYLVFRDYLR